MARRKWIAAGALGAVVVLVAGAWLLVDPNNYKARLEQVVLHDTGRALTLGGALHLRLSPELTLVADKVAYDNPPGYSRPQMFTADQVRATLALLPLLHGQIHITRLVLVHPDLLLERNAAGAGNWLTRKAASSGGASEATAAPPKETAQLQDLQIEDGVVTWRDPRLSPPVVIDVAKLEAEEAAPDAPITLAMTGARGGADFSFSGSFGSLARLLDRSATTAWPVHASLSANGATLGLEGSLTSPESFGGYDLAGNLMAPDLQALAPLVPEWPPPPPLHDVKFTVRVADKGGMPLISDANLQATRDGRKLSLKASTGPYVAGKPVAVSVAGDAFGAAFAARGDVVLQGGLLHIEHAQGTLPGGQFTADLTIDGSRRPVQEALVLHAPGLALPQLLTALDLPDDASGLLEVDADLHGTGETIKAITASLDGHLGLAMVNGTLDNRLITSLVGPLLRSVKLPIEVPPSRGRSDIRCFAARLDASHGIAAVRAALLDVVRFRITAAGTIDLGAEMMALRLRPYVLLAGNGVVVPLLLTGPFAAPNVRVSPGGPVESVASLAADLLAKGSRLTPVTSALASAGEQLMGDADTGNCAPALLLARDGADGPQPPPPRPQKDNPIGNLLRGLFK